MKKRLFSLFTAFIIGMSLVPVVPTMAVGAETSGDFEYEILYDGTVEITDYNGSATNLTIPSTIDGKQVTSIGNGCFDLCYSLASIEIPEGITKIGIGAFFCCSNLKTIIIPKSVTNIAKEAFAYTEWLQKKQEENPLVIINNILVDGSTASFDVVIPDGVTCIVEKAFYNIDFITFAIPKSLTSIGNGAFENSTILELRYEGSKSDWESISIQENNEGLLSNRMHYNYGPNHYNKVVNIVEPSCVNEGENVFVCECGLTKVSECFEEIIEFIPMLDHNYITNIVQPTCTVEGYISYTCSLCGYSYKDSYTDATGHNYSSWIITKSATCTTDGTKTRKCSLCDKIETQTISKTGHNYSVNWTIDKQATCTSEGSKSHHCTACGTKKDVTAIAKTAHKYDSGKITKQPTCTATGVKTFTCSCGESYTETIVKTGHNYVTTFIEPTCIEAGYTIHICLNCGDSYKGTYTNAKGHSYNSWIITKFATCTTDGTEIRKCNTCGNTETQTISKTDHNYVATFIEPTCIEAGYTIHICLNCGDSYKGTYTNAKGHSYNSWIITKFATCTTDGTEIRKCNTCGNTETQTISKTDHNYVATFIEPTCIEAGYTIHICSNCERSYRDHYINATGHKYTTTVVKPTYSAQGYTLHKCSTCGNSYKDNYKAKLTLSNITKTNFTSSANAVKMSWNKVSGATGYRVYKYNISTKKWQTVANTKNTSYTFNKLKSGTTYKFTVRAYRTEGGKTYLSPKYSTFTTSTNPATVNFKLSAGSKKATVKWSKVTGATGYKVYYKTSKNGSWKCLKTANNKTTSYTKTGLTKGKTYYFTVKAYRTVGGKTYNGSYVAKSVKVK